MIRIRKELFKSSLNDSCAHASNRRSFFNPLCIVTAIALASFIVPVSATAANNAAAAATTASSLPATAAQCALAESGTCTFVPGTVATIYYGAGSSYLALSGVNSNISCSQNQFGGDPDPGVYKACYAVLTSGAFYADFPVAAGAQSCSAENGACTIPAGSTATVYYGAQSGYLVKTGVMGSAACSNSGFGADPDSGVVKSCYLAPAVSTVLPSTAAQCASAESGTCSFPTGTLATVYYGAASDYFVLSGVGGNVPCNQNEFGGDPAYGLNKACYAVVSGTAVNLTSAFNVYGIFNNGSAVSNGGLDGAGYAYSANLLGASVPFQGIAYSLGASGTADAVSSATLALPPGSYSTLNFLGTGTFGSQTAQTFTVTYSDGTTSMFNQSLSDWGSPQSFKGESKASSMTYRVNATGAQQTGTWYLYSYSFSLNAAKTVKSFTLPNNRNVAVLAVTLSGATAPPATGPFGSASCATAESGTCTVSTGVSETVYYGANNSFLVRNGVAGSIGCNQMAFGGNLNPGLAQACFASASSTAPYITSATPAGAQQCAMETGTCVLSTGTTGAVYYGAGNNYVLKLGMTGSVPCSVSSFGVDPAPYVLKACYAAVTSNTGAVATTVLPFGSTQCAVEAGTCTIPSGSTAIVYYGANNSYLFEDGLSGAVACSVSTFGSDPASGIVKACYLAAPNQTTSSVSLAPSFNVAAITSDGTASNTTMFNQGYTSKFSQSALGSQMVWNGSLFTFGPPNVPDAVSNTSVVLPPGNYGRLDVLAARISGNNASENFTITYTDGSTSVISQGMSDWGNNSQGNANYPNESTASYMAYLNASGGNAVQQAESLYGYTFNLNPAKTVSSLTLPADASVGILALNLGASNVAPAIPAAGTPTSVLTHHNDTWRTGMNTNEYQLTPATVANVTGPNVFGKLGAMALDEAVDAQPLVVPNISVAGDPNAGTHDVVYVATRNNTIYAIDPIRLTVLAQRNLGAGVANPLGAFNQGVSGLRGTPVIDTTKGALYAVAYVQTANSGPPQYVLHMLSLSTLADMVNPVTVAATGQTTTGTMSFNATYQMQRPALLESGGNIFVAFGSWGDLSPNQSRGWVLSFSAATLQQNTAATDLLNKLGPSSSTNYFLSSVWMSGAGPAVDEGGDLYFSTGNSQSGTYDGINNVQESVVKLNPLNGQLMSIYTPNNQATLDAEDNDLGAGGVLLLPDTIKRVGAIMGKDGIVRVFNRDNLGGNNDANLLTSVNTGESCGCALSYFNDGQDRLVASGGTHLRVFSWQTGQTPGLSLQATAAIPNNVSPPPGAFTSISSAGTSNGIIWVAAAPNIFSTKGINLLAFQATPVNGTLPLLYLAPAGGWPYPWGGAYHTPPTVANGRVYVASQKQLFIFGFGGVR